MKRGLKENCTKLLIEDCVRHSHLPSCFLFFFSFLRNPQNVLLPWNPCSASPRMKSSEVAHFFYLLRKKALYLYLAVCTTHPLYPFIPCWLKYQLTRIVNPVFFPWKSNVFFFFPGTSAFQSLESFNCISVRTVTKNIFLLMIVSNFSQLLQVFSQCVHS